MMIVSFFESTIFSPIQKSFTNTVLYGRPRPCRTKSESQASTSQLRQADRRQGKRKALARPSSAKAIAGHPPDQTAPGQTQGAPKAAHRGKLPPQLRQADRCQGKRKALARPSSARASAGHPPDQTAPGQTQGAPKAARQGKLPPQLRQADRRRVYKPKSPAPRETGDFSCRDPELLVAVL